jgi:hypothetical protein
MNKEPVLTAATISGLVSAALVMLVALEVLKLNDTQMAAIVGFVALAAPIVISLWPRSQVTPLNSPKDVDGVELSRPGDKPAIKQLEAIQSEAIEMNKGSQP